jgi:hypothetical protein
MCLPLKGIAMRTTIAIDDDLLAQAALLTGVSEKNRLDPGSTQSLGSTRERQANCTPGWHRAPTQGGTKAADGARVILAAALVNALRATR